MIERAAGTGDRLGDLRMGMTKHRAHLAGGEIKHPPPGRIVKKGTGRAHRHERNEVAAEPQHVPPRAFPEEGLARACRNRVHARLPRPQKSSRIMRSSMAPNNASAARRGMRRSNP